MTLLPGLCQLPVPFDVNFVLVSAEHVLRRDVADGAIQTDVIVMVYVTLAKTKVVCGDCNNGWMSDLETRVKLMIGDMVYKCTETTLQDKDIATVAAWVYTKAIVAEHSHDNTTPFWTFAERQPFRQTLSIPNGVQMWLASLAIEHGLLKSYFVQTPLNTPRRFELNVFTYGLGHFVIQVVTARWNKKAFRRHAPPPILTPASVWDSCSIPFWPSNGTPVSWPPAAHLIDRAVEQFVQRWMLLERGW
jgi:hypothetical protein